MPSTRAQHSVFPILMAFAMVYGMELYNQALMAGGLTTELFLSPFGDMVPLMAAVRRRARMREAPRVAAGTTGASAASRSAACGRSLVAVRIRARKRSTPRRARMWWSM